VSARIFSGLALAAAVGGCVFSYVSNGTNPIIGCSLDSQCPSGSYCNAGACQYVPRTCSDDSQCDPGQRCTQGSCLAADLNYCFPCLSNPDCDSGICAQLDAGPFCAASCDACPNGGACQFILDGSGNDAGTACLPQSGSCL
jgi:hypothetical protein